MNERKKEPTLEELTSCIILASTPIKISSPQVAYNYLHVAAVVQLQGILKRKHESQHESKDT